MRSINYLDDASDLTSALDGLDSGFGVIGASAVWSVIALIIAIIGGICLYFTVFSDKNKDKYTGFMAKFYDFVKFKKMFITSFLKALYIVLAIYITLLSFGLISTSFLAFLMTLIVGNITLRVIFEFSLVILGIYENTNEIAKNTKNNK